MNPPNNNTQSAPKNPPVTPLLLGETFFTGFPGFLSSRLVNELVSSPQISHFHFLVLPSQRETAKRQLTELEQTHPDFKERWSVYTGDITDKYLGLGAELYTELTQRISSVWHLAALYDLAVAEQTAYRVNLSGTIHILDFCQACTDFRRLNYVSTCYVAGYRTGTIREDELDVGQAHKNHYESTKFWAEVEVQRRSAYLPTVIFRPGITVGDSSTGETDKYDGPYFLFQALAQLPNWMPMVNIGRGNALVNIVPVDFVVRVLAYLGQKENLEGQVFHVADSNPMRAREIIDLTLTVLQHSPAIASVPASMVQKLFSHAGVEKLSGIPREALDYFNHDARYDTNNTTLALAGTDIHCPHLSSYLQTLIDYLQSNPKQKPAA